MSDQKPNDHPRPITVPDATGHSQTIGEPPEESEHPMEAEGYGHGV